MRNVFICLFILFVFASSSFSAQEYGRIKVLPPTEDCEVMIDGIQVGTGSTSTRIAAGVHKVVVNLKDGTPLYNKSVEVIPDEISTVAVSYELKKQDQTEPESGKVSIKSKKDPSDEQDEEPAKEWGEGFGISIGADNTNYTISAMGDSQTLDLGGQLDLSLFYTGKLGEGIYGGISGSLLRTYGSFDNAGGTKTSVTSFPICLDVKFKANENLMFGVGLNYSYWSWSAPGVTMPTVTAGLGYQAFLEIKPLSSEIGYIVKNGAFSSSGIDFTLASAGAYYKYKIYF